MADKKISQLTAASTPLTGTEELAIVQSGSTVKATAQDVADLAGAPYLVHTALISQSGTSNPVATVMQNTIGETITWTYLTPGFFQASKPTNFGSNTIVFFTPDSGAGIATSSASVTFDGSKVNVRYNDGGANALSRASIEIRVYP